MSDDTQSLLVQLYSMGFERPDLRAVLVALKWIEKDEDAQKAIGEIRTTVEDDPSFAESFAEALSDTTGAKMQACERLAQLAVQNMEQRWIEHAIAVYLGIYSDLEHTADFSELQLESLLKEFFSTPSDVEEALRILGDEQRSKTSTAKPSPSANPFDPATGLASVPSDPFTLANVRGLMKAQGTPSPVRKGEWREDSLGRPVFQYRLSGPPWGGMGTLSLIEDVEAHQAWKMLEDGDLDAVTLYFLYLAYASDTSRRGGIDKPFRIDKRTVFHALGLHRRKNMTVKEKVQKVMKLNAYLRSFQIQLTRVSYAGDKVRTDAISPALLWDTYVRGLREDDLFGEPQWGNFWISGREGAWAHEFLHSDHGGRQWTALPLRVLEDIDRRSEWPRRILFHSLLMFRINKGAFTRTAEELLRWCRCDPSMLGRRQTKGRRKKKLLNALDELKQHGFQIEDSRLRIKGRPFDEWLSYKAKIHPPEDMGKMKYLSGGRGAITAPREDMWTGGQIRALRKHIGDNQTDFADRFGVSQPTVSLWENGHEHPTAEHEATLDNIADAVGFAD